MMMILAALLLAGAVALAAWALLLVCVPAGMLFVAGVLAMVARAVAAEAGR